MDNIGIVMAHRALERGKEVFMKIIFDPGYLFGINGSTDSGIVQSSAPVDCLESRYLHWAASEGDAKMCHDLLASKCYMANDVDSEGMTPLHHACKTKGGDTIDVVVLLVKIGGSNVNAPTIGHTDHFTLLHLAASYSDIAVVHFLVSSGADIHSRDRRGCTPVLLAAQHGHLINLHYLFLHGANLSDTDCKGAGLLIWAAYEGHVNTVVYLLKSGADIRVTDHGRLRTALHWAVIRKHYRIVEILLREGADVSLKDNDGVSPKEYALQSEELLIREVLCNFLENKKDCEIKQRYFLRRVKYYLVPVVGVWLTYWCFDVLPWFLSIPFAVVFFTQCIGRLGTPDAYKSEFMELDGNTRNPTASCFFYATVSVNLYLTAQHWDYGIHEFPEIITLGFLSLFATNYYYHKIRTMDAGTIIKADCYTQIYGMSNLISVGKVHADLCSTCWIRRPRRSKHCRICNVCVNEFDHHCQWINNCIGLNNRMYFPFLCGTIIFCISCYIYVGINVFWNITEASSTTSSFFFRFSEAAKKQPAMAGWIVWNMLGNIFMCIIIGPTIALFFSNTTTNEWVNWKKYAYLQDENGNYFNPYNQGYINNIKDIIC